jgi:hypothetical protein
MVSPYNVTAAIFSTTKYSKEFLSCAVLQGIYCKNLFADHVLTEKLIPNLQDKLKYVTHYKNLKLYKRLELEVTVIQSVVFFAVRLGA